MASRKWAVATEARPLQKSRSEPPYLQVGLQEGFLTAL